ncbi:hypothetical protein K3495_g13269, partial [Podosphaera aphanis]
TKLRYSALDNDLFLRLLNSHHDSVPISAQEDLETEASNIVEIIRTALLGACPRKSRRKYGTPWWNDECRYAAHSYRRARREGNANWEKIELQKTVRRAKKDYWNSIVDNSNSLPDVYRVVRWHNSSPRYQSPPLHLGEDTRLFHDPQDKARLLYSALLCRNLDMDDIPFETPAVPSRDIPWQTISNSEALNATCRVSSTSPREDELTSSCLRLAWPTLGDRITKLFNSCVQLGIHPRAFKRATVVILPKPGKRDRSIPKSYRPISLLSCLGKGLERLIARRISYWALKLQIIACDQCSAVGHRSASDLTTALVCDVRQAWRDKKVAGVVTVDVKGAFDGVLRNRLIYRLRTQGWPNCLIKWVSSFFSERFVRIFLDQVTTDPLPVVCGLPQGSPVSLILFLLYVEPLLRLSRGRFGYADDAAFYSSAKTLRDCHTKLQRQLDISRAWASDNGIQFDMGKTELIYFHGKRKFEEPSLQAEGTEIRPNGNFKWLGILFDQKLSFKDHVRFACQRARVVIDHVRRLCNTTCGVSPGLLRQAVQGCAFATLFYGAETWYGPQSSKWALNQVQLTINRAARAVLPVYKTFPIPALLRETGWGPAKAWLERIQDRLAIRVAAADPHHPLRNRWNSEHFAWIRRRQALELSVNTDDPPWLSLDHHSIRQEIGAAGRRTGLESYECWTRLRSPLDLTVFSDGSMNEDGNSGAGYSEQSLACGQLAPTRWPDFAKNVAICLDNEEAAIRLHAGRPSPSSSTRILDFQELRGTWKNRERATATLPGSVQVRWVPAHQGITGNLRADALAKEACNLLTEISEATIARAKSLSEERYLDELGQYWNLQAPRRYKELGIEMKFRLPMELFSTPRLSLGRLLAARSRHGDFAEYHRRFKHTEAEIYCSCGQEKSPEHPFSCQLLRRSNSRPSNFTIRNPTESVKWILSTSKGAKAFHKWIVERAPYE